MALPVTGALGLGTQDSGTGGMGGSPVVELAGLGLVELEALWFPRAMVRTCTICAANVMPVEHLGAL